MVILQFFALALTGHPKGTAAIANSANKDYSILGQGGLYVEHNWINPEQIAGLQRDISYLRTLPLDAEGTSGFQTSGLSNRSVGDENLFGPSDRLTCTITACLGGNRQLRAVVEGKLENLKLDLQDALGINNHGLELAELYYSSSPTGSFLPRHMDERHENTKGEKGWMNDTRRSISWLLYLNDHNWGSAESENAGGELRAYCRKSRTGCGSHEGNIQVGWLSKDSKRVDRWDDKEKFDPVFLDSWVKTPTMRMVDEERNTDADSDVDDPYSSLQWRPLSALYRLTGESSSQVQPQLQPQPQQREYLSDAFGPDSPSWPSDTNLDPAEFASALASQLPASIRNSFISTEATHEQPMDISPTGGTLVMFDSVAIPHEVLLTTKGERLAMAGWFHELQQPFPEWYGT
jgi:hypothetical protein